MNKISIKDVIEVLKKIVDPEIGLDIVDLGLVYGINIDENNNIDIKVTMTSPTCPVTSIILANIEMQLESLKDVGKVNLELVWDPAWSPEMMSDEAKAKLNVL